MNSANEPTASAKQRYRRQRGRSGIDGSSQSPTGLLLPPLQSQRSPTRHVSLVQQQSEEQRRIRLALLQRLDTTKALLDLASLKKAIYDTLQEPERHTSGVADEHANQDDCFSEARRVFARLERLASTRFLSQFLLKLSLTIESLAHAKRQRETNAATKFTQPDTQTQQIADGPDDQRIEERDESAPSSASSSHVESSDSDGESADTDYNQEPTDHNATSNTTGQDLRHVPTKAVFRTTLRSRRFPHSRVIQSEFVQRTTTHLPFDSLKRPPDLASLRLKGHDEHGAAQWSMVLFPKRRPCVANHEEIEAFLQWAASKRGKLDIEHAQSKGPSQAPVELFLASQTHFKEVLDLNERLCYEVCRFVFDKCPTTARFLHGLVLELGGISLLTLANAEREQEIRAQRHKNVQLELTRLNEKLVKMKNSLTSLEETLAKRQQMLLRERELIIRKRKRLNIVLGADQILIRRITGLIHLAQGLGDDIIQNARLVATAAPPVCSTGDSEKPLIVLDGIIAVITDKYHSLPPVAEIAKSSDHVKLARPSCQETESAQSLVILDEVEVQKGLDEYKATLLRLTRMVSAKSPDTTVGWEAQELWDQALFIPPHEEVQDLERVVQRLSLYVEERMLSRRHLRVAPNGTRTASVQTVISACTPKTGDQSQRWRARPFTKTDVPTPPPCATVRKWDWRRSNRRSSRRQITAEWDESHHKEEFRSSHLDESPSRATTLEEDHRDLLKTVVPEGFRAFIRTVPYDYSPHQLDLHQIHSVISFIFNSVWMLVQEDFQRPPRFSTSSTDQASLDARLIPLSSFHEYIYRIFLQHFHIESVVTSRILDLLVSAGRLDTQSGKVQLFCQLLGLSGVDKFPSDGFWFVLKSLHVLQRCCGSSGGYFLLDAEGDNEFVSQASATDALSQLFPGGSNEVLKRLRLKLSGLASVYGAVWIPAYNVLTAIVDEWKTGQESLQVAIEEKLFLEHASDLDLFTGTRVACNKQNIVSFSEFLNGFKNLQLHVNHSEAVQAYRQLLHDSTDPGPPGTAAHHSIDRHLFFVHWVRMILHAVNVSQQQMLNLQTSGSAQPRSVLGSSGGALGPGIQLGAISDAMLTANQRLSFKFLLTSWEQMKPEIIRRLDVRFNDVGLQVRLVQQVEATISRQQQLQRQHHDPSTAWRTFLQLIQIAYTNSPSAIQP